MRWTKYAGDRIAAAGHRTFVELPPTIRFGQSSRRYGYVWPHGTEFRAYYEVLRPGEVADVELGAFLTAKAAREAVEAALKRAD